MSAISSIQLNYPIDSEEEEGECEDDSVILKRALDTNERIKEMLKSQSLRDIIKDVLDKHEKLPERGSQSKKNNFGLQTWEQTFLKDFILQSKEFKNLVQCIMETLSEKLIEKTCYFTEVISQQPLSIDKFDIRNVYETVEINRAKMNPGEFWRQLCILKAEAVANNLSTSNPLTTDLSSPVSNSPSCSSSSLSTLTTNPISNQTHTVIVTKWGSKVLAVVGNLKFESLIAGVTGGVLSTLVLHPLDLLKIRFAVNDGRLSIRPHYQNLREGIKTIFKQEGIGGFYRGTIPNLMGAGVSWGLYFLFYNCIKDYLMIDRKELTPWLHLLAAGEAGVLTVTLTNPFWVVKTRLCLQYGSKNQLSNSLPSHKVYSGTRDAFYKIYKHEGIRGMYKGVVPGLFGVTHGSLQFMVYEELKKNINKRRNVPVETKLDNHEYVMCAAISKLIAASITFPYQVVRARLQDQHTDFKGVRDVIVTTWRSGFRGFYRGFPAYIIHVTPNIVIVFWCYETITNLLKSDQQL